VSATLEQQEQRTLRIGEVARRLGTTARTIRYYEEIGLLPAAGERAGGAHRAYVEADVERIAEILRLKELLVLSLEAVRGMLEAEEARRVLRERFFSTEDPHERRGILQDALVHVERQLELVRERRLALDEFEQELTSKRRSIRRRLQSRRAS
jgi:DNA-binding transcriptional MerR regulator